MHFSHLSTEPLTLTQDIQNQTVTVGENANFTCRTRGTNITVYWEIEGDEYRDCDNQDFCIRNMSISNSVTSTFTVDTNELGNFTVRCVVNQTFGDRSDRNSSTGQLIVQSPPPPSPSPSPSTSKTHTHKC